MKLQLLEIVISILAGIIIMIFHELPKSILFLLLHKKQEKTEVQGGIQEKNSTEWVDILKVKNYIDPIGLLLCVVTYGGFSKPYMYRIRRQKTNFILGITGFCSLLLLFFISIRALQLCFNIEILTQGPTIEGGYKSIIAQLFWIYMALFSFGMFVINLFPVSVFDMGLIIAGKSPSKYFAIIKNDSLIKLMILLALVLGMVKAISLQAVEFFLAA